MGRGPLLGANDNTDKSIGNFLLTMSSSSHPCTSCVIQIMAPVEVAIGWLIVVWVVGGGWGELSKTNSNV